MEKQFICSNFNENDPHSSNEKKLERIHSERSSFELVLFCLLQHRRSNVPTIVYNFTTFNGESCVKERERESERVIEH